MLSSAFARRYNDKGIISVALNPGERGLCNPWVLHTDHDGQETSGPVYNVMSPASKPKSWYGVFFFLDSAEISDVYHALSGYNAV